MFVFSFFNDLEFFDKDHVSDDVFDTMHYYCVRPDFTVRACQYL